MFVEYNTVYAKPTLVERFYKIYIVVFWAVKTIKGRKCKLYLDKSIAFFISSS